MTVLVLAAAEADLQEIFDYYQMKLPELGDAVLDEFRQSIAMMLKYPNAWQALDGTYRRYRLNRFPYGIIYRVDMRNAQIIVIAISHLSRRPNWWQNRERQ